MTDLESKVKLLETILDNIQATVYAKNLEGRFIYVNNLWCEVTDNARENVIGKTDFELNDPVTAEHYWALDRQVIAGRETVTSEEIFARDEKDHAGSEQNRVLLSIKVPLLQKGEGIGLCGIGIDISEIKHMEKALIRAKNEADVAATYLKRKNTELLHLNQALEEERKKSEKLLLNILPKAVADELMLTGKTESVSFDDVAVLFSDIVEFTNISATMEPQALIEELNIIFTEFDSLIEENRCERIKTIGDAYLAVCGIPDPDPDFADHIVQSAVRIICYLKQRVKLFHSPWKAKIGIHGGRVVGGVVGVKKYIYDVFGNTVNMASRLQNATKIYHVDIIISESIYNKLKCQEQFSIREIDTVRVKGDTTPIVIYEVYDCDDAEIHDKKRIIQPHFEKGLKAYKAGAFTDALEAFKICQDICDEDEIPKIYIKRCSTLMRIPPSPDWAGISGI